MTLAEAEEPFSDGKALREAPPRPALVESLLYSHATSLTPMFWKIRLAATSEKRGAFARRWTTAALLTFAVGAFGGCGAGDSEPKVSDTGQPFQVPATEGEEPPKPRGPQPGAIDPSQK